MPKARQIHNASFFLASYSKGGGKGTWIQQRSHWDLKQKKERGNARKDKLVQSNIIHAIKYRPLEKNNAWKSLLIRRDEIPLSWRPGQSTVLAWNSSSPYPKNKSPKNVENYFSRKYQFYVWDSKPSQHCTLSQKDDTALFWFLEKSKKKLLLNSFSYFKIEAKEKMLRSCFLHSFHSFYFFERESNPNFIFFERASNPNSIWKKESK